MIRPFFARSRLALVPTPSVWLCGSVGKPLIETNLYNYVLGDPVNFVDPNGESATAAIEALIGVDIGTPDPTDAAWPKWAGYGILLGGAVAFDWFIYNNNTSDVGQDAQAPGCPTKEDGFTPKKNWDGNKVKNPNGPGSGYPDKSGNIWVPTGPGPKAHGGPHWDMQNPKTGKHKNIYPGGRGR